MIRYARTRGLKVMVGCMLGSSLAMAPAYVAALLADIVDLDGPLLLAEDRSVPIKFTNAQMQLPSSDLWG